MRVPSEEMTWSTVTPSDRVDLRSDGGAAAAKAFLAGAHPGCAARPVLLPWQAGGRRPTAASPASRGGHIRAGHAVHHLPGHARAEMSHDAERNRHEPARHARCDRA